MESKKLAKSMLVEMTEKAGSNGIAEWLLVQRLMQRGLGLNESISALLDVSNEEAEISRVTLPSEAVVYYKNSKQEKQPEQPQESLAVRLVNKHIKPPMGKEEFMSAVEAYTPGIKSIPWN